MLLWAKSLLNNSFNNHFILQLDLRWFTVNDTNQILQKVHHFMVWGV